MSNKEFRTMIENHRVAGIVADKAGVDALISDLTNAGYDGDGVIMVHHGQAGLREIDPEGIYHGARARFVRNLQRFVSEGDNQILNNIEQALKQGKYGVTVLTDGSDAQRIEAGNLFKANGATSVFFKGSGFIEFL